jgi:predicted Fe-Mo cluster-binding NifX family protein
MKTIITSLGDSIDAGFDLKFGRAGWFCVYDRESKTTDFIPNSFKDSNGGAGTKSSEMVAELGANQVISGHFGPKAKDLLERLNIQMITMDENELLVVDIINKLENTKN